MSMFYRLVLRQVIHLGVKQDKFLFFPQTRTLRRIGFPRLCKEISAASTASPGDVQISLTGLTDAITTHLSDGDSVQMGDFGSFHVVAGAPGVEKAADFNPSMFRRPNIVFTPGRALKEMLNQMNFEKLSPIPEEAADPSTGGGEGGGEEGGGDDVLE